MVKFLRWLVTSSYLTHLAVYIAVFLPCILIGTTWFAIRAAWMGAKEFLENDFQTPLSYRKWSEWRRKQ